MAAIRTIPITIEKNTKVLIEHTDHNGRTHTIRFGRKPDGEFIGDKAFMDFYEFAPEGNKPIAKLRLKVAGEEDAAWFAAGWEKKDKKHKQPPPQNQEFSDSFPEGW